MSPEKESHLDRYDVMRKAFRDELTKISGELQGFTRSGRKPIGIERMLERETEDAPTPSEVAPAGTTEKTSGAGKNVALLAGGALGYHAVRQANEDRRMGKMMRKQQG